MTEGLYAALDQFRDKVNRNARLRTMLRDWDREISVLAGDLENVPASITMRGGEMDWRAEAATSPQIELSGPSDVLIGIFNGSETPTEPYLDGRLKVRGTQDDVLRLDFISLMIWGE